MEIIYVINWSRDLFYAAIVLSLMVELRMKCKTPTLIIRRYNQIRGHRTEVVYVFERDKANIIRTREGRKRNTADYVTMYEARKNKNIRGSKQERGLPLLVSSYPVQRTVQDTNYIIYNNNY